jgi:hypothetical protein
MENMNQNTPVVAANGEMTTKKVVGLAAITTVGVMILAKAGRMAYGAIAGAVASAKAEAAN